MNPLVSIIIVNYNGKHFLKECLQSVFEQDYSNKEIIVVDNGSTDGSARYVKENFPTVKLIESEINRGFAGGNNLGVERSNGDLVVLLNNDTSVHSGWLSALVETMSDDSVACASSLIKTQGIPDKYYEKNGSINFLGHNIMRIFDEPSDIFFPGGASMIFRKNVFGRPFDEDYFVYAEDVYLGLRARFMGYQVKHTNGSVLDHYGSGTSKNQKSEFITFYQERNRLLNTFLFFTPKTLAKVAPILILNMFVKSCVAVLGYKYSIIGLFRAYGWFFLHIPLLKQKRLMLQSEQKVDESEIIRSMTGKMTNGESSIEKIINMIFVGYCRVLKIKVIECSA